MDFAVFGHGFFDTWQLGFLLVVTDRDTALAVGFASFANGGIVDVAAEHQGTVK